MVFSEVGVGGPQFFALVPWIIFFPLAGILVNLIIGGRLSEKAIGWVASSAVLLAFGVSVLQVVSLISQPEGMIVHLADWIRIDDLRVRWAFQVDTLSVTMMLVVSGIGSLIHIYAIAYMHEDVRFNDDPGRYRRFFIFFNLFILAMMVLVSANNYLMLFVGWEGVGLCSYLLIGFWYDKGKQGIGNALAGKKAFITNRIGDFGFLLAVFTMYGVYRGFDFDWVFMNTPQVAQSFPVAILLITVFMLLGVAGKSAQIPLFVWLPDAMAGPTPVSALIHAATMVTAGVYLIARSHPLYALVPMAQNLVALVGGLTALFAATIAVGQFDIKKVLAYSTISQLGFMVAAVGMGAFTAGMFHLVTHAFFKALLFLSSGSVILGVEHGLHEVEHAGHDQKNNHSLAEAFKTDAHHFDPQDMRNMGGLRTRMPTTFWVYLVGALALGGIVPLAGFWSKDEILLEASRLNPKIYWMLSVTAFFTAFYMGRQVLMVFFGEPRSKAAAQAKENPPLLTTPLIILAGLSALGGALNLPWTHTFGHWLEHTLVIEEAVKEILTHGAKMVAFDPWIAGVSTLLALMGIFLAWLIYGHFSDELGHVDQNAGLASGVISAYAQPAANGYKDPLQEAVGPVFNVLNHKYWIDEIYAALILQPYQVVCVFLADVIDWRFWHDWFHDQVIVNGFNGLTSLLAVRVDLGFIDGIANGIAKVTQIVAQQSRRLQTGSVRNYALSMFVGVVLILGYLIIK